MEGTKKSGPTTLPPSSPSLAEVLLGGGKKTPSSSSPSSLFNTVFPPASTVLGRDSSRPDIFGPSNKYEGPDGNHGMPQGSKGRGESVLDTEKNSAYPHEKIDPCLFGSSVYYGAQDFCSNNSSSPDTRYQYKRDGEDVSKNSDAAFRGNWWEGSLYY